LVANQYIINIYSLLPSLMDINNLLKDFFSENIQEYANNLFKFVRDIPYEIN